MANEKTAIAAAYRARLSSPGLPC